jgi:toxin ParE1/3/4
MKRIIKRAAAYRDLDALAEFIGQDSPHAAIRFLEAADKAFELLLNMPGMGSLWQSSKPDFAGLRVWPIRGFEYHLIFYRTCDDGIEIVRVLHGARDIDRFFPQ